MRVSLLSIAVSTSGLSGSGAPRMTVAHASSLRHSPSGIGPAFWLARGGSEYFRTPTRVLLRLMLGEAESREAVLVSAQVTMLVETLAVVPVASSAALEDRKNSVPCWERS